MCKQRSLLRGAPRVTLAVSSMLARRESLVPKKNLVCVGKIVVLDVWSFATLRSRIEMAPNLAAELAALRLAVAAPPDSGSEAVRSSPRHMSHIQAFQR